MKPEARGSHAAISPKAAMTRYARRPTAVYAMRREPGPALARAEPLESCQRAVQMRVFRSLATYVPIIRPVPIAPPMAIIVICLDFKPLCKL